MAIHVVTGNYANCFGWPTLNWGRMKIAHQLLLGDWPDFDSYFVGTFNINLNTLWVPPDDDAYRLNAHSVGVKNLRDPSKGADFLYRGNYLHPQVRVLGINGIDVSDLGTKLYYPGKSSSFNTPGVPGLLKRDRLEVVCFQKLSDLISASNGNVLTVTLDDGQ